MATLRLHSASGPHRLPVPPSAAPGEKDWYAIYTLPQNERSVARYLEHFEVETFLPVCESVRRWKNRQSVRIVEAVFPSYVFARIHLRDQGLVLRAPGVRRIIGNGRGPLPLRSAEIDFMRSETWRDRIEPYQELAVGERVRITQGFMQGLEGVLVRKKNALRFVLTLELINQNAAVEVSASDLESAAA
jgi:transcription antitermination factor NusG